MPLTILSLAAVLAEGFQLSDGRVEITVPYVQPGCGYQLVCMYSLHQPSTVRRRLLKRYLLILSDW